MNTLILIWKWLVKSSADSEKLSLTIKGTLLGIVPVAIYLFGAFNIEVASDQLTSAIDGIVVLIGVFAGIVSAVQIAVGVIRKIWTTFEGTNSVIIASSKE
jgi:uncharacterized membrane protein (GlpM family)